MNMNTISLDRLPAGEEGVIESVNVGRDLQQRVEDLGFLPGATVKTVMRSAAGDPTAYGIRDTVIALRRWDAEKIYINTGKESLHERD